MQINVAQSTYRPQLKEFLRVGSRASGIFSIITKLMDAYACHKEMAELEALPFSTQKDLGWPTHCNASQNLPRTDAK